jgi:flagellar biosynthesis protein FliR
MDPHLTLWFLVFARAGALVAVVPAFSAQVIPVSLRIGLAALMAFLVSPFINTLPAADLSFWSLIRLLFIEISVGLLLGFVCRLLFFAVDLAGAIAGTEIGLSLSTAFNPLTSSALPLPGLILFWLAMMLLFSLNLHHWILAAFQHTYALAPIGGARVSEALTLDMIRRTSEIFRIALQMTAPVMAVSFVVTLIFSILSRAVPQMNVFTESFPVRTLVGLAVFGLTCHLMAQHLQNYLLRLPDDMLRVARLLQAGP